MASAEIVLNIVDNLRTYAIETILINPKQALQSLEKANNKIRKHIIKGRALTYKRGFREDYLPETNPESQYQSWSETDLKK